MSSKSLRRRPASISPPVKFTIFSEGKNTEPEYFDAFDKSIKGALVSLTVVKAAGVPKTIATKALEFRKKDVGVPSVHSKRGTRHGLFLIAMNMMR